MKMFAGIVYTVLLTLLVCAINKMAWTGAPTHILHGVSLTLIIFVLFFVGMFAMFGDE